VIASRLFAPRTQVWPERAGWATHTQGQSRLLLLDPLLRDLGSFALPADALGVHGATRDGSRLAVSALQRVVVIDHAGRELWQFEHPSWGDGGSERGSCCFSADDRVVWAHVPRDWSPDEWVVLDAETAEVMGRAGLSCKSAGSQAVPHPDRRHVGLAVGEGQDGSRVYWGSVQEGSVAVNEYPALERVLAGISPSGEVFVTTPHSEGPLQVHRFPDGSIMGSLEPETVFGDGDDDGFNFSAGFPEDRIVVFTGGERGSLYMAPIDNLNDWQELHVPEFRANPQVTVAHGLCLLSDWGNGSFHVLQLA